MGAKRNIHGVLLGTLLCSVCLLLAACGSGGQSPQAQYTHGPAADLVTQAVEADFDSADVQGSFERIAQSVRQMPDVVNVQVFASDMKVSFTDGLAEFWGYTPDMPRPVWVPDRGSSQAFRPVSEKVDGDRALIINAVANDSRFDHILAPLSNLADTLQSLGYTVQTVSGDAVLLSALADLSDYAVIVNISHGMAEGAGSNDRTWIMTGDRVDPSELVSYFDDWMANRVTPFHGFANGNWFIYWEVSDLFFDAKYPSGSMRHGIFYNGACQGMLDGTNTSLAQVLVRKGMGVYLGWTDVQGTSPYTAQDLLGDMNDGDDLHLAYDNLPEQFKVDQLSNAELRFFPAAGGTIQLTENTQPPYTVEITSPADGYTSTSRVITVSGTITPPPAGVVASIYVNDHPSALSLTGGDTAFSQNVVINDGANTITVRALSGAGSARDTITVHGDIAPIALWTELIWDTDTSDVDFHLLRPGATIADMWGADDCCYENFTPSWGAVLDVDDVEGFGPEHVTMLSPGPGIYTLLVHFFDRDQAPPVTNTQVFVSTLGGSTHNFGPRALTISGSRSGDVWTVCTIEFPSGNITEINDFRTLSSPSSSALVYKGK